MRTMFPGQAVRIVLGQVVLTTVMAALALLLLPDAAPSVLVGGVASAVPNLFFARKVFGRYEAGEPGRLLGRIYGAELAKLVLTGMIFAGAIFWLQPLLPVALFGAYLLVHLFPAAYVATSGRVPGNAR